MPHRVKFEDNRFSTAMEHTLTSTKKLINDNGNNNNNNNNNDNKNNANNNNSHNSHNNDNDNNNNNFLIIQILFINHITTSLI